MKAGTKITQKKDTILIGFNIRFNVTLIIDCSI